MANDLTEAPLRGQAIDKTIQELQRTTQNLHTIDQSFRNADDSNCEELAGRYLDAIEEQRAAIDRALVAR